MSQLNARARREAPREPPLGVLVQVNTTTYDGEGDQQDVLGIVKVPLDDLRLSSACRSLADPALMVAQYSEVRRAPTALS